jgi:O-antigen/teichoic acid export membrane protein
VLARLKNLVRNLAIYGLGDVAPQLVSFLLLPIYTRYLTRSDYGIIAMLLTIEAPAKILFRWGVDGAFMRFYYDCADQRARQRLASTIFLFLSVANGALAVVTVASAGWLSSALFGSPEHATLLALTIANTFVVGFYFIPFQVLRIKEQSGQFIALTFGRSTGTILARLVLVVGFGMGVYGVVLADVLVTLVFTVILGRWFVPLLRPMFSRSIIREALGFGLPRIPHSLGQHVIGLADRYFLNFYGRLADVGLYSIGATFGLALKLFISGFEYAWTPFFLGVMKEPDAKRIYATVSTYVVAVLVLLGGGLCVIAPDLVRLVTAPAFHAASAVTPWIALGVMFQGFYITGSIGLVITKRTRFYPLATGIAAAVSVGANALLVPRHGMLGAAWANALAYGTLTLVTTTLSWRAYPIPYEWSRLARIALAGVAGFVVARRLSTAEGAPLVGILLRGSTMVAVYCGMLFLTRFFHGGELRVLNDIRRRVLQGRRAPAPESAAAPSEMAGEMVDSVNEPAAGGDDAAPPRRDDDGSG